MMKLICIAAGVAVAVITVSIAPDVSRYLIFDPCKSFDISSDRRASKAMEGALEGPSSSEPREMRLGRGADDEENCALVNLLSDDHRVRRIEAGECKHQQDLAKTTKRPNAGSCRLVNSRL